MMLSKKHISLAVACLITAVHAEPQMRVGFTVDPCALLPALPVLDQNVIRATLVPGAKLSDKTLAEMRSDSPDSYRNRRLARSKLDFPELCYYAADNAAQRASGRKIDMVLIGDSITENWQRADPSLFASGIVDRGIGGQTTPQMVLRFHADVVSLKPRMVHIMAGTNDAIGQTGPTSIAAYQNNIVAMVEMSRANGIEPVLGSILPSSGFENFKVDDFAGTVRTLNLWLRNYAESQRLRFVDYYPLLADNSGAMQSRYSNDGVHPTTDGYAVMRPLLMKLTEGDKHSPR